MEHREKPCMISCGIFKREIEHLLETGDIDAKVHFLSERLHMDYSLLDRGLNKALKKHSEPNPQSIIVVYGDACLGFNDEMKTLMEKYDAVKVDGLNCIDCLLGGRGKLLEIDPEHKYLFLNPAFINFPIKVKGETREQTYEMYSMLDGIILLDEMGDLDDYQSEIDEIVDYTGLRILERKEIGLDGLKNVLLDALEQYQLKNTVKKEQRK
jgi:hypothetical protein